MMFALLVATLNVLGGVSTTDLFSLRTGPSPHVSVQTTVGAIRVTAGGTDVEVTARKSAKTQRGLAALHVTVDRTGDDVSIRAVYANGCAANCDGGVSFEVRVPAASTLDLKTATGDVDASGLEGDAHLATLTGSLSAEYRDVSAVRAISMSAEVGRVTLALPRETKLGYVRLRTMVGRITSDWPVAVASAFVVNASAEQTFVPGGLALDLSTLTGGIYLRRE